MEQWQREEKAASLGTRKTCVDRIARTHNARSSTQPAAKRALHKHATSFQTPKPRAASHVLDRDLHIREGWVWCGNRVPKPCQFSMQFRRRPAASGNRPSTPPALPLPAEDGTGMRESSQQVERPARKLGSPVELTSVVLAARAGHCSLAWFCYRRAACRAPITGFSV
jgi:hypothetical protein